MKYFTLLVPFILLASEIPMPPAMPQIKVSPKKEPKNTLPKECKVIPPMLIFMPPPLQKDLTNCKNHLYMPSKEKAQKYFKKQKILKIEIVNGFDMLYKITTDKGVYYCNKEVSKCFKIK